jgi:hypothetical protein
MESINLCHLKQKAFGKPKIFLKTWKETQELAHERRKSLKYFPGVVVGHSDTYPQNGS